ncbi:MAG: DMT family transporter [Sedimentisphaerales bacterium]|nr:DMT family transporter [Sedimentisphaerales bacterium]
MAREDNQNKGAVLIISACIVFCSTGILIKMGHQAGISPAMMAFGRFIVGLLLLLTGSFAGFFRLRFNDKWRLFGRGFFGGIAIFIAFLSISRIGLGKGTILMFTYPIYAAVFSSIFLKERFGVISITGIIVAMFGVFLMAAEDTQGIKLKEVFGPYELAAVFGAVLSGAAVTLIRKLHDTDDSYAIYFSQCFIGLWMMAIPVWLQSFSFGASQIGILLGIGVSATGGQLLMTQGFKYVPVRTGSLLAMLDPVFAYSAGILLFGESLNLRAMIGTGLVLSACVIVLALRDRPVRIARQIPE